MRERMRRVCRTHQRSGGVVSSKITSTSRGGKSTNNGYPGVIITLTNGQSNSSEYCAVVSNQPLRLTALDGKLIAYLVPLEDCELTRKYILTRLTVSKVRKWQRKSSELFATPHTLKTLKLNVAGTH